MTDPAVTHQEQLAIRELAARLSGWATGMQDPEAFATSFIAWEREHGWHPALKPQADWKTTRPHDPDAYARGAEAARRALAGEDI